MSPTTTNTTCPYCGVGCGVQAATALPVRGDSSHPANFGKLCVKGSALHETQGLHGRLLYPELFGERVSWDTALAEVASQFTRIIAESGPDAVAFYLSGQLLTEDYYVANKLMKGYIGTANVDTNSRLCMASAVAAHRRAFGADLVPCSYEDLELADLLVIVGSNAAWTHPILYQRMAAAARDGRKVVVVDPRRTATCDLADLHLAITPGSDGMLFCGLLHHLARVGAVDQAFVSAHTNGFDAALAAVSDWSLGATAAACGISEADLATFFDWFAATERSLTFFSQGINQSATGVDKGNAIINCHLATGRIGKPGAGPFSITGQPNAMGGREAGGLANQLAAHLAFEREGDAELLQQFWGSPTISRKPGLKAVDLFDAIEQGKVRAVWIMATNPVVSLPDAERVRKALANCELVVVSDCVASSDTLALAHVRLPAAGWGEKDGTVTNSERRISRQRSYQPLPAEVRPDWWIISQFARHLGFGEAFGYDGPAAIFREHAALSGHANNGKRLFDISALSTLSEADYNALAPIQWPVTASAPAGTPRLFTDGRFDTADGKARFIAIAPQLPLAVTSPRRADQLILNTGRLRDQWHTMTRTGRSNRLLQHSDRAELTINPADAARLQLSAGQLVVASSGHGQLVMPLAISSDIAPGQAFAPIHWNRQWASEARVGALIAPLTDPISGQPQFKQSLVAVAPLAIQQHASLISRTPVSPPEVAYWARLPHADGARLDLAHSSYCDWAGWLRSVAPAGAVVVSAVEGERLRLAVVVQGVLWGLLFVAPEPTALPPRGLLSERLLGETPLLKRLTTAISSGCGRTVCSCFNVGEATINAAIVDGCDSVAALGQKLKCGSNCGSCIPELKSLLAAAAEQAQGV